MSITFSEVELKNPEEHDLETVVKVNEITLISGKNSVQTSTQTFVRVSFRCLTEDYNDISQIKSKIGTKSDLIIDESTYSNCVITSFRETQIYPNVWEYEISFTQDTS